jgi:hypothetical protein
MTGHRLQLGRLRQAAPLKTPAASIQKIALVFRARSMATIEKIVAASPAIMSGQNKDSLNTKILMPTAPGYKVASKPEETATKQVTVLVFGSPDCPNPLFERLASRAAKNISIATPIVPAMQPATLAQKIADQENDSPGGNIAAKGDKNKGYSGARNIWVFALPY